MSFRERSYWERCRTFVTVFAVAVLAGWAVPAAVGAQEGLDDTFDETFDDTFDDTFDEDVFVLDGVGPGVCLPQVAVTNSVVECRFPLIGRVQEPLLWQGAVTAFLSPDGATADSSTRPPCVFGVGELRCPGLRDFYQSGPVEVSLELDGQSRSLASFDAVNGYEYDYSMWLKDGREPVAFARRPVVVDLWANTDVGSPAWAMVQRRVEGPERFAAPFEFVRAEALAIPEAGTFEAATTELEAPTEPGRYVISLCVGDDPETCSVIPGHYPFQVVDPALAEVVPGHNRADASRINLVFVGAGLPSGTNVATIARNLLTVGGPVLDRYEAEPLRVVDDLAAEVSLANADPEDFGPGSLSNIVFGPFAIEPLAGAADKFNFWFMNDPIEDERALFHNADPEFASGNNFDGLGLDHVSVVTLHHQASGRYNRSEAWWTGFKGRTDVPELDELDFAGVYLAIDARFPLFSATTLAHELGHALFDLRDEYSEFDRAVEQAYPNCASSVEEAELWWGDLVGQPDEFATSYIELLDRYGWYYDTDLIARTTVAPIGEVTGGCYGGGSSTLRPTVDSIMNSEVPIFGAVNSRRVVEILDRFDARVDLADTSDVHLRCFPATLITPGETVRCSGELSRWVDPTASAITVSTGSRSVVCEVDTIDEFDQRGVSCPELVVTGDGPWPVLVAIGNGEPAEITRLWGPAPEPLAQSTPTTEPNSAQEPAEAEPTSTITGTGEISRSWAVASGLVALAVVGLGGWWLGQRNQRADAERAARERAGSGEGTPEGPSGP
jgi:hypothetical protein